jgi:hypothetical protein
MPKATKPLEFKLTFETAASLLDVLTGVSVRAIREQEQKHESLMHQWKTIEPLFHYIRQYVDDNS